MQGWRFTMHEFFFFFNCYRDHNGYKTTNHGMSKHYLFILRTYMRYADTYTIWWLWDVTFISLPPSKCLPFIHHFSDSVSQQSLMFFLFFIFYSAMSFLSSSLKRWWRWYMLYCFLVSFLIIYLLSGITLCCPSILHSNDEENDRYDDKYGYTHSPWLARKRKWGEAVRRLKFVGLAPCHPYTYSSILHTPYTI